MWASPCVVGGKAGTRRASPFSQHIARHFMHTIEPFSNWLKYYDSSLDDQSPFYGKEYNYDLYTETIYGYYIDPAWDSFGSETLYLKILYIDYHEQVAILELLGEWNDTLHNDIMELKRNIIEPLLTEGIHKFILLGENIMNFHGADDCYYEEWQQDIAEQGGWIAAVSFPEFVRNEMKRFQLHLHVEMGDNLTIGNWRTLHPHRFYQLVEGHIQRRLS